MMRILLLILFCFLLKTGFSQTEKADTSIRMLIKVIEVKKSLRVDTTDFTGKLYFKINNDTFNCSYSNSILIIDKQRWEELGQIPYSKTDSAFLYLEKNKPNPFIIRLSFKPFRSEGSCLLEIKRFGNEPGIYECSFWSTWGNMGTLYRAKGETINKLYK